MELPVILIIGPTASGKTELGVQLAERLGTEIISADSRQVFRQMSIGTAHPTTEQLHRVKHHLIDCLEPDEEFNASIFENAALKTINELHSRGKIPVVVGGSGLYIKALVDGIFDIDSSPEIREDLMKERAVFGDMYMYEKLRQVDSLAADTMLPQNWKRVIRALEVFSVHGKSIIQLHKEYSRQTNYRFIQAGLNWKRDLLYERIDKRVDEMITNGLFQEVRTLIDHFTVQLNALNTVGYKEVISMFQAEIDEAEAIRLIKRNTRHYAKRQMTWFRKDDRIRWFDINCNADFGHTIEAVNTLLFEQNWLF